MLRNTLRLAVLTFFIGVLTEPARADPGVNMIVEGVRNTNGKIVVLVFDNAAAFESLNYRNAVDIAEINADPGSVSYQFDQLTKGPYAIFVFHDENGDDDLNIRDGRLLEGVGATGTSNRDDEPNFAQASVAPGSVTIRLHYDQ